MVNKVIPSIRRNGHYELPASNNIVPTNTNLVELISTLVNQNKEQHTEMKNQITELIRKSDTEKLELKNQNMLLVKRLDSSEIARKNSDAILNNKITLMGNELNKFINIVVQQNEKMIAMSSNMVTYSDDLSKKPRLMIGQHVDGDKTILTAITGQEKYHKSRAVAERRSTMDEIFYDDVHPNPQVAFDNITRSLKKELEKLIPKPPRRSKRRNPNPEPYESPPYKFESRQISVHNKYHINFSLHVNNAVRPPDVTTPLPNNIKPVNKPLQQIKRN